jgi:hypothetical protein
MVPDIDLQLRVVIKALREVVAPAVDPNNKLALEQFHLSLATLGFVESRLPLVRKRVRQELQNAVALAEAVAAALKQNSSPITTEVIAARTALADADVDTSELEAFKSRLLAAVSAAVNASSDAATDLALAKAVVAASKPQFDLTRAWGLPAGFEPDPAEVPPLAGLIASKVARD